MAILVRYKNNLERVPNTTSNTVEPKLRHKPRHINPHGGISDSECETCFSNEVTKDMTASIFFLSVCGSMALCHMF